MNETELDTKPERSKYQIEMYQAVLAEANAWRAAEKLRKAAQKKARKVAQASRRANRKVR